MTVLGGRCATIVISPVHFALIVPVIVRVIRLRIASPLIRIRPHRRKAHAGRHGRTVVVTTIGVALHASTEAAVPAGK